MKKLDVYFGVDIMVNLSKRRVSDVWTGTQFHCLPWCSFRIVYWEYCSFAAGLKVKSTQLWKETQEKTQIKYIF